MISKKILAGAASLIIATGLSAAPAVAGDGYVSYGAHYGGGYGGHHGGYRGGYRGRHHGGHGLAIAVPLALFAGVLIANSSRPRERVISYPAPQPRPAAANPWVEQPPVRQQSHAPVPRHASDAYCREYTSQIMIDGEAQNAYGQACRQEDGSWKIMSQNLVPNFD